MAYPLVRSSPKPQPMLERPAREKHSSLLQKFINYVRKKFYNIDAWGQCYKTLFVPDLRIFVLGFVRLGWKSLP